MFDRKQYARELRALRKLNPHRPHSHRDVNECGKVPYSTKEDALSVAVTRITSFTADSFYLRPYECPRCQMWHLTSKEKW